MKKTFYSELAYVFGLLSTALGVALMAKADFGLSMVVAPAFLIYKKLSMLLPWFSFGMAEYLFQGFLIVLTMIVLRKFKLSYFFSFVTVVIYGFILDGFVFLTGFIPAEIIFVRVLCFVFGMLTLAFGIAVILHTYIPPEAYELFVKEISLEKNIPFSKFKTLYDVSSLVLAIVLSFSFFGFGVFVGVKVGTFFCALVSGFIIGRFSALLEKHFEFKDKFNLRKWF